MRIQIYISVSVLILIHKHSANAASRPSPPANVSIRCDNYGVEVGWDYPDPRQDVLFWVEVEDIMPHNERKSNNTTNLHFDISSMLSESAHNEYFVFVKAVRGGQESDPSKASFSFNENRLEAKIKCYLDFPEVKLSPRDGKLHVQFPNPLRLYNNTPALRGDIEHLVYTVTTAERVIKANCDMEAETCETSVEFSEHGEEYCVNLTGRIGQRPLKLRSSCFSGDIRVYPSFTVYLYPVLGVFLTLLFLTGIILLLASKCISEIKKESISAYPWFLVVKPSEKQQWNLLKPKREVVDSVLIETPQQTTSPETFSDEEQVSADKDEGSGDPENKNSPYEGNYMDDADSGESLIGYDCPHAVRLEMDSGDMVNGYGP